MDGYIPPQGFEPSTSKLRSNCSPFGLQPLLVTDLLFTAGFLSGHLFCSIWDKDLPLLFSFVNIYTQIQKPFKVDQRTMSQHHFQQLPVLVLYRREFLIRKYIHVYSFINRFAVVYFSFQHRCVLLGDAESLRRKRRDVRIFSFTSSYNVVQYFSSSFSNNFCKGDTLVVVTSSIYYLTPCTNPYPNILNQMQLILEPLLLLYFYLPRNIQMKFCSMFIILLHSYKNKSIVH